MSDDTPEWAILSSWDGSPGFQHCMFGQLTEDPQTAGLQGTAPVSERLPCYAGKDATQDGVGGLGAT